MPIPGPTDGDIPTPNHRDGVWGRGGPIKRTQCCHQMEEKTLIVRKTQRPGPGPTTLLQKFLPLVQVFLGANAFLVSEMWSESISHTKYVKMVRGSLRRRMSGAHTTGL